MMATKNKLVCVCVAWVCVCVFVGACRSSCLLVLFHDTLIHHSRRHLNFNILLRETRHWASHPNTASQHPPVFLYLTNRHPIPAIKNSHYLTISPSLSSSICTLNRFCGFWISSDVEAVRQRYIWRLTFGGQKRKTWLDQTRVPHGSNTRRSECGSVLSHWLYVLFLDDHSMLVWQSRKTDFTLF